jgi:hypothetical protein
MGSDSTPSRDDTLLTCAHAGQRTSVASDSWNRSASAAGGAPRHPSSSATASRKRTSTSAASSCVPPRYATASRMYAVSAPRGCTTPARGTDSSPNSSCSAASVGVGLPLAAAPCHCPFSTTVASTRARCSACTAALKKHVLPRFARPRVENGGSGATGAAGEGSAAMRKRYTKPRLFVRRGARARARAAAAPPR